MKFCIGKDMFAALAGYPNREIVNMVLLDLFKHGQYKRAVVEQVEREYPAGPNSAGFQQIMYLGVYECDRVKYWLKKLQWKNEVPGYSLQEARGMVEKAFSTLKGNKD